MRLSDLQNKDVVDVHSGIKLGSITDVEVDNYGKINGIYIYSKKGLFNFSKEEGKILWNEISKIGTDVILVSKKS